DLSDPVDPVNPVDLVEEARRDDLLPLIARGLRRTGDASWTESLRREAHDVAGRQAALEHFQRLELVRLLDGLAAAAVRPLLMKGAALAYTVYPDSSLRPHNDVDLFVCDDHRHRASRALPGLGYTEGCQGGGDLSFSQAHYGFLDRYGVRHTCDLHWRIANPLVFRNMVTFGVCEGARCGGPVLPDAGAGLAPVVARRRSGAWGALLGIPDGWPAPRRSPAGRSGRAAGLAIEALVDRRASVPQSRLHARRLRPRLPLAAPFSVRVAHPARDAEMVPAFVSPPPSSPRPNRRESPTPL